jgi:hypothetical protein
LLVILRFFLSDCLLPSIAIGDAEGEQDAVWNPHEPPIRIRQGKQQSKEYEDRNPTHDSKPNHERTFTRAVCPLDAEIGSDKPASKPEDTAYNASHQST